jgi:hypothetical protein
MDQYNKKKFSRYIKSTDDIAKQTKEIAKQTKENKVDAYIDKKRNCVGCTKNTLARKTLLDPPAPVTCVPLLTKLENEAGTIFQDIGLTLVGSTEASEDYFFIQAPNGLALNLERLFFAYEKFVGSLPEGGVEAFVQKFITDIFVATAQATETLFITIFISIILQSYILYLIVLFIFWINKITTTGITLIWAFIGFIIAAAAFTVMAVEASRQSVIISNTVEQQLTEAGTSVGSITCALSSALTCYFDGVTCNCKNAVSTAPCGSTGPFERQNSTSITIEKYSGTPGKFFFTYSGPLDSSGNNLNIVNAIAVVETGPTGSTGATGSVTINNLANGNYIVNEISQVGWDFVSVSPNDNIVRPVIQPVEPPIKFLGTITFTNKPTS